MGHAFMYVRGKQFTFCNLNGMKKTNGTDDTKRTVEPYRSDEQANRMPRI